MFRAISLVNAVSVAAFPALAQSQGPIQRVRDGASRGDANRDGIFPQAELRDVQIVRWPRIDRDADGDLTRRTVLAGRT